jgi:Mycoplasma protein of unknown function, DUF285
MKQVIKFVLWMSIYFVGANGCNWWPGKCKNHSDCCNNRRCMTWGRCSLLQQRTPSPPPRPVYKCFETRDELSDSIQKYDQGNETIKTIYGNVIGDWCVDLLTDFSMVFQGVVTFNEDISKWKTSSATKMTGMFKFAQSFNQNLKAWDVSSVIEMTEMFFDAAVFDQDLSLWNVSSVTKMNHMFYGAVAFNQNLSTWDISSVLDMSNMFDSAATFNQSLCAWGPQMDGETSTNNMFYDTSCPDQNDPIAYVSPKTYFCQTCNIVEEIVY